VFTELTCIHEQRSSGQRRQAEIPNGETKMILYIYANEDNALVARINGDDNASCESVATDRFGDTDHFGWTYSPAFGATDGLVYSDDVEEIDV
jgi:hypothetical protein